MDINGNFNNYKTSFSGVEKKEIKMFDKNEAMNVLMTNCKEGLYNAAEKRVPENGIFGKVSLAFVIHLPYLSCRLFFSAHYIFISNLSPNHFIYNKFCDW